MIEWIEINSADRAALSQMADEFKVHPLALEDCYHRDQRPKLDDYENHQLLVWFMLAKGQIFELQFLIFSNQLILVSHEAAPDGKTWQQYLKVAEHPAPKDVWHLLYYALDCATDITWQEARVLFGQIDDFEQKIFQKTFNAQELLKVKKKINRIDYSIGHHSSVAKQIQNLCKPTGDLNWKLRDLYDHCQRIDESIALYRSQISTTLELFWGIEANRTNHQMMKLTTLASVSVPLTFWASFWGMNFEVMPFSQPVWFYIAMALMLISVAITTWFLIKKGYLSK